MAVHIGKPPKLVLRAARFLIAEQSHCVTVAFQQLLSLFLQGAVAPL
jgi:hypothetical protein